MPPEEIRWIKSWGGDKHATLQSRCGHVWGGTGWRLSPYLYGWELTRLTGDDQYSRTTVAQFPHMGMADALKLAEATYWLQAS